MLVVELNLAERVFFFVDYIGSEVATYFSFGFSIFFLGVLGIVFNYKNFLITMMSAELMYLGVILLFILAGWYNNSEGQIYALLLLMIAASESALGLGLLIVLYRFGKSIDFQDYHELKG